MYPAITIAVAAVLMTLALHTGGYLTEGSVARQRRTVYDLKDAAQALRAFRARYGGFPPGTWPQVSIRLVTEGLAVDLPSHDVYGTPYDYQTTGKTDRPGLVAHFRLRGAGRDRRFESTLPSGPFDPRDFGRDIVVADERFLQWPQRTPRTRP